MRGFNTENEMSTLFSRGRIFDGMGSTLDDHAVLVEDQRSNELLPNPNFPVLMVRFLMSVEEHCFRD